MIYQIGVYKVYLSPAVEDVLCGWQWVHAHKHDLDNYHPEVFIATCGVRYNMTIKDYSVIKDVCKTIAP